MFPQVKLDGTSRTKIFFATNGEKIKDLSEKTKPFKSVDRVHKCKKKKVRKRSQALDLKEKGRASWQCRGAPHNRASTFIMLDVNNGVYTTDMWMKLDKTGLVFSWNRQ